MAIFNVGSINRDRTLMLDEFPQQGETVLARSAVVGTGGKGLNQTVAIHRAGGVVTHIGAVGSTDAAIRQQLASLAVDDEFIVGVEGVETGSATILVDRGGENRIVLEAGANARVPDALVNKALRRAAPGDWLLFQNETNQALACAHSARARDMRVGYSAAPFDAAIAIPLLAHIDLISVNSIELAQLLNAIGGESALPPGLTLLVTRGADGAEYRTGSETLRVPGLRVPVVDTTGAGDTFLGTFLAQIDGGNQARDAMVAATAAAALQIGRQGATEAIPTAEEVAKFRLGAPFDP